MIYAISRHVAFFIYPQFNLLDLSGPLEALATAASMAPGSYRFTVMSLEGGEVEKVDARQSDESGSGSGGDRHVSDRRGHGGC